MRSRRYSTVFSALCFLSAAAAGVFACAWYDENEMFYSFFAPEVSRSERDAPFFRSFHLLYTGYTKDDNIADFADVNIAEWEDHFGHSIPQAELRRVLYAATAGEADSLLAFYNGVKSAPRFVVDVPTIVRRRGDADLRSFLDFTSFAKRCEPYVTYIAYWTWDSSLYKNDPRRRTTDMDKIIRQGMQTLETVKDSFLRERYHFQVLRMLFHRGQYKECHEYFRRVEPELSQRRSIRDRCTGYAAGALYRQKRYAEANYLFSLLYDRSSIMRTDAFLSFHPQEERDWKQCLALARTTRERTVLWQLLGIYDDPLRAMKEIRAVEPGSDLMDLLLVRAVNIAEIDFMPDRTSIAGDSATGYALKPGRISPELLDFVTRIAREGNAHAPCLWNLAAGYLMTVRGDYHEAAYFLEAARTGARGDTLVQEQARVTDIVRKVEAQKAPDAAFEADIVTELKWLEDSSRARGLRNAFVLDWAKKRLAQKYIAGGALAKAQCLHEYSDQYFYQEARKQELMIAYMDRPGKTEFDRYLLSIYPYSRSDIFELQAVSLFYEGRIERAITRFRDQPGSGGTVLPGDPFLIHIKDCHDCDHAAPQAKKYTKLEFAERLLELERLVVQPGDSAAQYAIALANGYYNATFWGNARVMYQTKIREYSYINLYNPDPALRADPVMDCSKAERFYLKARELSHDKELKAMCTFMAAKCEQNTFFLTKPGDYQGDFRAGKYFSQLRKQYSSTRYYRDVIGECGYFRTYLASMKRK
jgi:hypothetical protein